MHGAEDVDWELVATHAHLILNPSTYSSSQPSTHPHAHFSAPAFVHPPSILSSIHPPSIHPIHSSIHPPAPASPMLELKVCPAAATTWLTRSLNRGTPKVRLRLDTPQSKVPAKDNKSLTDFYIQYPDTMFMNIIHSELQEQIRKCS